MRLSIYNAFKSVNMTRRTKQLTSGHETGPESAHCYHKWGRYRGHSSHVLSTPLLYHCLLLPLSIGRLCSESCTAKQNFKLLLKATESWIEILDPDNHEGSYKQKFGLSCWQKSPICMLEAVHYLKKWANHEEREAPELSNSPGHCRCGQCVVASCHWCQRSRWLLCHSWPECSLPGSWW